MFSLTHIFFSEFFGVDPSFPADQMMTRIASDSGRNIYFVSDSLKQIVTSNQDRIKVRDFFDQFFLFNYFLCLVYQHGCSFIGSNRFTQ